MTEADRIFAQAAGPQHYPAWLYLGGCGGWGSPGLKGGCDRLVACFRPCTLKPSLEDQKPKGTT